MSFFRAFETVIHGQSVLAASRAETCRRWVPLLFAIAVAGCGDSGIGRRPVRGTVIGADGRQGLVSFVPRDGTMGPAARTQITDGKYAFDSTNGPVPGEYDVVVWLTPKDLPPTVRVKEQEVPRDQAKRMGLNLSEPVTLRATVPDGDDRVVDLSLPAG